MSSTDRESRVGSEFGPYLLRRLIARGGMGEVYEAEDKVRDRIVALKLLPEAVSHDPVFRERLHREARSAGRLQEPHVVPIHDYGEIDGLLYVDMRFIDGNDLRKVLRREGPLPPARAVAIIRQVASALDAAHESGVMHRDVKPENILVTRDDFVYLVDFGIANAATDERLTELGTAVGTYAYMAPERFTSDEVTYRADIYSLACVLHECLTGAQPYTANSVSVVITAHLMQPIPKPSRLRPGIPKAFDDVIARGMAKKPEDRYESAGELARAANDALSERDQNRAATILARSEAATLPTTASRAPEQEPSTSTSPYGPTEAHPEGLPTPTLAMPTPTPAAPPPNPQPASPSPYPATGAPSTGAPPPWQPLPSGPVHPSTDRTMKLWIVIGTAAGVVTIMLGGVGFWFLTRLHSSSSSTMSPGTSTYDLRLLSLLPSGYSTGTCEPVHPPVEDALSTVDCGKNSTPGGPTMARYSMFGDLDVLNRHFQASIKQDSQLVPCPNSGVGSPTTWHYKAIPDKNAGQIACGTYDNNADVAWTKESYLLLGDAQGAKLDELHQWWLSNG